MKLLVIADDFTGALDTAAQFAAKGISAVAALRSSSVTAELAEEYEAVSVNLETRHVMPSDAYIRVESVLREFSGVPYIYLKTDSVLRGNLSASFRALLDVRGGPAMFLPAYPESGRTTAGGRQYIGGISIDKSSFARDPLNPVTRSYIPDMLSEYRHVRSYIVGENMSLPGTTDSGGVYVFDCLDQDRLENVADALARTGMMGVTAGCAGFAGAMASVLPLSRGTVKFCPQPGPVLFLSGSVSETTFRQIAQAKKGGIPVFTVPDSLKLQKEDAGEGISRLEAALKKTLDNGFSTILATAEGPSGLAALSGGMHTSLQGIFAQIANRLVRHGNVENLAIFGGDTASAVLEGLGIDLVRPVCEIQPGVPVNVVGAGHSINLVTKSGGLGDRDAVMAVDKYLRGLL